MVSQQNRSQMLLRVPAHSWGSGVEVVECASVETVSVKDASPPRLPLHFLVELLSTWDPSSMTRAHPTPHGVLTTGLPGKSQDTPPFEEVFVQSCLRLGLRYFRFLVVQLPSQVQLCDPMYARLPCPSLYPRVCSNSCRVP